MKKVTLSMFVVILLPLLFLICKTPDSPFTIKNIKLEINSPNNNECVINKEIPIKVIIKLPHLIDKVHLKYTDSTEHNLSKDISLNPNIKEVIFNVTFNKTGKIELIASSETNNVENFKIIDTIDIGMAPYLNQKNLIKTPEKPLFNKNFKLIVDAKVFGEMTYTWTKNFEIFKEIKSNPVLNFNSLSENDQGVYQCEISNTWGKDISNTYNLVIEDINQKPKIISHPQNATVTIGNSASFNVNVSGKNLKYQWQKNDTAINNATASGYKTNPATKEDNGSKFKCIVSNNSGYVVSNEALLIVTDVEVKPEIIKNPENVTVFVGENATFTIEAEGTNLEYQWQKNGNNIENATNVILELTEIPLDDNSSKIRCIVKNTLDTLISAEAILTVNNIPKPEILYHPKDIEVKVGEKAQFDIGVNGKNLEFQWQENENDIINANSSVYILRNCLLENNNTKFRCVVSNSGGKVISKEAKLTVKENVVSPTILTHPIDQQVLEGEDATFTISATGTTLKYKWEKNGNKINGANDPSFIYKNVKKEDNGAKFICIVSNSVGTVRSKEATLTVEDNEIAPKITSAPVNQSKKEGEKVSFSITATGTNLKYKWYKNNNLINGANINVYQIKSIDRKDNGALFKCSVENSKDKLVSAEANLEVFYLDIVQNPKSKTIEYGNEVTFTVKADGFPSKYNYQWIKKGINVGNNSRSYTIPSVSFDDEGQIQCEISNGKADDVMSKSAQLTVKDKEPQILNHPTDQSVFINSTATFKVKASGTNLKYQWQCNGEDIQGKTKDECNIKAEEKLNGAKFTCKVSNSTGEVISNVAILNVDKLPTTGLVAYYPFNGNCNDESDFNKHGNVYGPEICSDRFGNDQSAYAFDGNDDYIEIQNSEEINVNHITISAWVYIVDITTVNEQNDRIIVMDWHSDVSPWMNYGLHRIYKSQGVGVSIATGNDANLNCLYTQETILKMESWTHLVASFDGSDLKLFVNGKLFKSSTTSDNTLTKSLNKIHIGANYNNPEKPREFFKGKIDDIRIYNRALTSSEIMLLYNEQGFNP